MIDYSKLNRHQIDDNGRLVEVEISKCLNHHNLCSYIEEQYARGRMVSPHLSIYKLHWATLSSGCHRLTGLGLYLGIF